MANNVSGSGAKEIQYSVTVDTKDFEQKISQMKSKVKSLGKSMGGYVGRSVKDVAGSMGGFVKQAKDLGNTAKDFSKKAGKIAGGISGFGVASKMSAKAINKTTSALMKFSGVFTRIFKMMRLMLLRKAIRGVIENVGDGFKGLAMYSKEFDNSMSMITNSSKQLGYSIASMVAPLLNAFAPALTYIIELCNKVVVAITQLFSALSGASTFITAKKQVGSWADSLEESKNNAKQLKKTLLSFDEINKLDDPTSGSSGKTLDPDSMFETKPVESKFKDLAKKIKDIFNKLIAPIKKAWEKMGDFVVKSWKSAFEKIGQLGKSVFEDFMKVWNQDKTVKIFENIFEIIGNIGVAVGNLADRFREAWEKNNTGLKILENIRDCVLAISEHAKNISESFVGWTRNLNFSPLLEAFERFTGSLEQVWDFVGGVLEDLWNDVIQPFSKHLIEETIPALMDVFTDFNNKVDWDGLREKLDKLWKALEPFAETVADGLVIFIKDVSDAIANFANSEYFETFLELIEEWIAKVDAKDVANGLGLIASAFLGFEGVGAILGGTTNPLGAFITVVVATYTAIATLHKNLKAYKDYLGKETLWEAIINGDSEKKKQYALQKGHDPYAGGIGEKFYDYQEALKKLKEELKEGNITLEEYYQNLQMYPAWVLDPLKEGMQKYVGGIAQNLETTGKAFKDSSAEMTTTVKTQNVELEKSYSSAQKTISGEMHTLTKSNSESTRELEKNADKMKNSFSKDKWTFSGVAEGLKKTFSDAVQGVKDIWNRWANGMNGKSFNIGDRTINFRLPTFAVGGFPEDGLFMANHGEMVGRFSNGRTAVANNEQITTGIANAVYQAMMMANGGNNNGSYINNTIMVDSEVIARAVTKGQQSISRRYSPSMA